MTLPNGITVTVTRRTAAGTDNYGDPTYTTATTQIAGCAWAPAAGSELTENGREGVLVDGALYAPPDADIQYDDLITFDSTTYEVDGTPGAWSNPYTGIDRGVVVNLRRVTG